MSQTHSQTAMIQDKVLSEFGNYDAGWTATCNCGTDLSPLQGRATKADTERAMSAHLVRNGVTPAPCPV